jgi:hypothetical protein
MSTHCLVGVIDTTDGMVHARYVHSDGHPSVIVPTLGQIWSHHAGNDTTVLVTAILAFDWDWLGADVTADTIPTFDRAAAVAGVGMTLAVSNPDGTPADPRPIRVFPLSQPGRLGVSWIYLIDVAAATVAVHTATGDYVARYHLAS